VQILVINCGSSSLKASLYKTDKGVCTKLIDAHLKGVNDPSTGLAGIFESFAKAGFSFEPSLRVGHRFVHGGDKYRSSILLNAEVIKELEKLSWLAPLHNDICLAGIKTCIDYFGEAVPQIAVFDTAFHRTMPPIASNYALPRDITAKYPIQHYGFHGISHAYLAQTYAKHVGQNEQTKIITLHLGNGCSMAAIRGGKSMDTSMGFTPAEGLIMSTRAGDIDAAIVEFLCVQEKKTPVEIMQILNSRSGLLGVSGISPDMKVLLDSKDDHARLAVDMFCYRAVKYLGGYIAALGGVEALIFSAGIGENSPEIRCDIARRMEWFGIKMDDHANSQAKGLPPGAIRKISQPDSTAALYVIATDENAFIAQEVELL